MSDMVLRITAVILALFTASMSSMADTLVSIADIHALDRRYPTEKSSALLTGTVDGHIKKGFVLKNGSDRIIVKHKHSAPPARGSLIRIAGYVQIDPFGDISVISTNMTHIADGKPPHVVSATLSEIETARLNLVTVRVEGVVTKAFHDEIDAEWHWLYLKDRHGQTTVSVSGHHLSQEYLDRLIDATISITGVCEYNNHGYRRFIGNRVSVHGLENIRIVKPAPADPFSVPQVNATTGILRLPQSEFIHRQRFSGYIVATWDGNRFILRTNDGYHMQVSLMKKVSLPAKGTPVTVVGFVQKNAFYIRLTEALMRIDPDIEPFCETPIPCSVHRILSGNGQRTGIDPDFHGRTIRLKGTVRHISNNTSGSSCIGLDDGGHMVAVNIGNAPIPEIGSVVKVTGACIMDVEPDENGMKFGRLKGFSVILRSPDDITVISRPPWWTPRRLAVVIASLIALLAAIITWNRVLQRIVERRSRALIKSQTGKIQAELRIDERTRLAVELHDSLAQNLTGISLQIAAAQTAQSMNPEASNQHMDTASRMLQSCRTELRRCIWDLRGDALEERNFAEAIRKTLQPIADSVTVAMRVDVPRSRLSDSTAHSVLRILRELASNAIRHGKARHIYVAGALETGKLQFSVRDDGCGFVPGNCPGSGSGHFGLDGIRERIKRLGGTFKVESTPGTGTYARFEIRDMSTNEKKDGQS